MALPNRGGRTRYTLIVLVLSAVTLLTLDFRGFGPLESAQTGLRNILAPAQEGASALFEPLTNVWKGAFDYDDVVAENARLAEELAQIKGNTTAEAIARAELEELAKQLDLEFLGDNERVVARVVGGAVGNFNSYTVDIDKGSADGMAEGMPVVTGAGLVGQLVRVDRDRSTLQLVSDPDFNVAVKLSTSRDVGIGHGNGSDDRTLIIDSGIEAESVVSVGDTVSTAGGASRFPAGLPIGLVTDVQAGEAALGQRVIVNLGANLDRLDFVTVVLYDPEAPDTDDATDPPAAEIPPATVTEEAGS